VGLLVDISLSDATQKFSSGLKAGEHRGHISFSQKEGKFSLHELWILFKAQASPREAIKFYNTKFCKM
jgi:hypothetical protein